MQNSAESIIKEDGSLAAAYIYSDFGETEELTGNNFDNEICYTGAVYDAASGLYYMNARYYNPANGRFISQDTYRGELDNPGQWHLYAYCANNPINYVDPSGHESLGLALSAGNYIVKGAVKKGATIIIGTATGTVVTVAAVVGTIYIAGYVYKKVKVYYSKGGKQKKKHSDLSGYSDSEVSALLKDKRLSKKERQRFVTEDKARKNRNKQKRKTKPQGRKR